MILTYKPEIKIPEIDSLPKKGSGIFKWIAFFLSPYKSILIAFFIFRIFRYTVLFSFPAFVGFLIDGIIEYEAAFLTSTRFYYSLIYLLVYFLLLLTPFIFRFETFAYETANRSLSLLGVRLLNLASVEWHLSNASGKKVDFIESARSAFNDLMILFRWQIVPLLGTLISSLVLIAVFQGPVFYSFLFFFYVVLFILSAWYFGNPLVSLYKSYREINAKVVSRFFEMSSSFVTIRSLNLESYLNKQTKREVYEAREGIWHIITANFKKWTSVSFVSVFFLSILLISGYFDLREGKLTPGLFSALLLLFSNVWNGLDGLSVAQDKIYDYLSSLRRYINFCHSCRDSSVELKSSDKYIQIPDNFQNLEMKSVSFSYNSETSSINAINEVNLTLEKNQKLAIVGESGAGKSTLIKLLLALYKPSSGSIYLNNIDINNFSPKEWICYFSYVPQDIEIFQGTIRENILLGRDIEEANYKKIISQSSLKDFISGLSDGDLTLVGERGLKLSGGQRQRIGIARALSRNSKVIILDEASSALDSITESKIQETLFKELSDVSLIIIAHRLSTIKCADRILVMDGGRIVESGSFDELKESGGYFSTLWEYARI